MSRAMLVVLIALAACEAAPRAEIGGFPSYPPNLGPPPGWTGPVFSLSQDFPDSLVTGDSMPWLAYDFRTQPQDYLLALRSYVYAGNIDRGTDAHGNSLDWQVQTNPVRRWYHMPWRHYGPHGREFVHGLTMEFPSRPASLDPTQRAWHYTWAVAMYNPTAGYRVGRVWPDGAGPPNMSGVLIPEGAVIAKLLFTTADSTDVPEVEGTLVWQANIYADTTCDTIPCAHAVQPVHLFQMDVAVKDSRAPVTQWVFGTFVYDRTAPGSTVWEKMVPLGLMWGNDPALTAAQPDSQPHESIILRVGTYQHLGCHKRLSGPVDNPGSSCMSCHMSAQWPGASPVPSSKYACDAPGNAAHWANLPPGQVFQPSGDSTFALDYSMEMASAVQNYWMSRGPTTVVRPGVVKIGSDPREHHLVVRDARTY